MRFKLAIITHGTIATKYPHCLDSLMHHDGPARNLYSDWQLVDPTNNIVVLYKLWLLFLHLLCSNHQQSNTASTSIRSKPWTSLHST